MIYDEPLHIIATSDEDAERKTRLAEETGHSVGGTTVWTGPVPPDSFMHIGMFRMARPEYMAYRKANELPVDESVELMCALLSPYDTSLTSPGMKPGVICKRVRPHMTVASMRRYLEPVRGTDEGDRAFSVLMMATKRLRGFTAELAEAYEKGWR